MKEVIIQKNDAGQRLDRYLQKAFPQIPASAAQKYIRLKRIKVNGARAQRDQRLNEGDILRLYLPDDQTEKPDPDRAFLRLTSPNPHILYEDENILLMDKPAGLLCHPDENEQINTLLSHMRAYLWQKGEFTDRENSFAPSLCNRIDRNTSGIVIGAKNAEALRIMNDKIKAREIEKYYLCLVHGSMTPRQGRLEGFLLRDEKKKQVYVYPTPRPGARSAKTGYTTLRTGSMNGQELSLLECSLITGRTHQIRAQMAAAGHPLYGDGKYGVLDRSFGGRSAQALCSWKLKFAFTGDSGILSYLNGRTFTTAQPSFAQWI